MTRNCSKRACLKHVCTQYAYKSNQVYFARLCARLCVYMFKKKTKYTLGFNVKNAASVISEVCYWLLQYFNIGSASLPLSETGWPNIWELQMGLWGSWPLLSATQRMGERSGESKWKWFFLCCTYFLLQYLKNSFMFVFNSKHFQTCCNTNGHARSNS